LRVSFIAGEALDRGVAGDLLAHERVLAVDLGLHAASIFSKSSGTRRCGMSMS
jgi:hypothetical protein